MNNIIGIFGLGVLAGVVFDLLVQVVFKRLGGRHLKKSYFYSLFLDVNLFIPALAGLLMILIYGSPVTFKIFLVSAIIGTILELLLGKLLYFLHKKPVWEYQYLPIGRFTSWISVLYWGGAGLLFLKIANWLQ